MSINCSVGFSETRPRLNSTTNRLSSLAKWSELSKNPNRKDRDGNTHLWHGRKEGRNDIVQLLLNAGAEDN